MKLHSMLPFRTAINSLIGLAVHVHAGDGLTNAYCSTDNTGAADGPYYNIYQSMGSCATQCQQTYAFAVLQGKDCWCSDYIPGSVTNNANCNSPCPGFPSDLCGNPTEGLFGYVALNIAPSGTSGVKPQTKTTSPSPTRASSTKQTPTLSSLPAFSLSSSAPASSSMTDATRTMVRTRVSTVSGSPVTHTVTMTPPGVAPNETNPPRPVEQEKGLSGGAIAGAVIGSLLGVALLATALFFIWRRKKDPESTGISRGSPRRKGSLLSRTGLLGGARPQSMAENNYDDAHNVESSTRPNSFRHSMMFGSGAMAAGVATTGPLADDSGSEHSERRDSTLRVYDQRLNPSALFANHDNDSRVSMQDQQDYSRPLGLANPDFARTYSFDSR